MPNPHGYSTPFYLHSTVLRPVGCTDVRTKSLAVPVTRTFLPPTWTATVSPQQVMLLTTIYLMFHMSYLKPHMYWGLDACVSTWCVMYAALHFLPHFKTPPPHMHTLFMYARTRIITPIDRSKKLDTRPESLAHIFAFHAPHSSLVLLPAICPSCALILRL